MLIGLILRGVSFDFRVKARAARKGMWNALFALGSLMAAMAQGWMLGSYLTGFDHGALVAAVQPADRADAAHGLRHAGRGLADHEDRRRAAAQGGGLGAQGAVAHGRGAGRHFAGDAAGQPDRVRQVVQHAAVHRPAADPGGLRRGVLRRLPRDRQAQGGRRRLRLGGVRQHRADLRAGLPGAGLQPLSRTS